MFPSRYWPRRYFADRYWASVGGVVPPPIIPLGITSNTTPGGLIRNRAGQKIGAQMITAATGLAFSGAVTVYVTGDAGTQAIGSVSAGLCTAEGQGYYTYAPAKAETNYLLVAFTFVGSGAMPATIQKWTIAS